MSHLLSVCSTCRRNGDPAEPREGARLFRLVEAAFGAEPVEDARLQSIECMSGCNRACTIGLSRPGKPSYLFADLRAEPETARQIVQLLRQYRDSVDGMLPRSERPPILRSGILARIPS